eukprot:1139019-Pelagomonas_calceolata.AAC.5
MGHATPPVCWMTRHAIFCAPSHPPASAVNQGVCKWRVDWNSPGAPDAGAHAASLAAACGY